ncbi:RING zinc finger protein-like protein [Rhizodiscina lignyota]|uniref:E3 ubiquitin-protein ligase listerin n=1 Tax=Rhizodiscina lignyota TaxID=1504668 RepID=A0A9P4IMQ2_9PEZI|nr:RING zinc finger protein-like protein [Rhizodiscina lignyota]
MAKRPGKTQASSARAASGAFGGAFGPSSAVAAFSAPSSPLTYVSEPPDLSAISDPNIVVLFKNLSKKDGTTKAKALEELQTYISASPGQIEDSFLDTWIAFYPRTSIDNARRVRQLAHTLHGQICASCGKRVARHMPEVVGPWLAGVYDSDKGVSKAAKDALNSVFSSPDKLASLRKRYQEPILDFCRNVIDNETPQTLSDERTASPDEIEAKYCRILAAVISLIASLLGELPREHIDKHQVTYTEVIQDGKLWKLAYYQDPAVRRATHRLLRTCLAKLPEITRSALSLIGSAYMHQALRSDQTGTSLDYSECLVSLVRFDVAVWTDNAKGSKGISRLCSFLKRGSQLGPPEFWSNVLHFFESLPLESYASTEQDCWEILKAMRAGINKKDEPRPNLTPAYREYIHVAALMADSLTKDESKRLLESSLMPIVRHHLHPSSDSSQWSLPETGSLSLIAQLLTIPIMRSVVTDSWLGLTEQLIEDMQVSLPEQAKEFDASQQAVARQGSRWASIQAALAQDHNQDEALSIDLVMEVVDSALKLLQERNGKPYGAASVVESILYEMTLRPETEKHIHAFIKDRLPELFSSPSAQYLAGILYHESSISGFPQVWETTLQNILNEKDTSIRERGLKALLASSRLPKDLSLVGKSPALKSFLLQQTKEALEGQHDWSFITTLPKQSSESITSNNATDEMLTSMINSLSLDETAPYALEGLQVLTKSNRRVVEQFMRKPEASLLLPRLLYLSESADDDTAQTATALNNLIQSNLSLSQTDDSGASQEALFRTIQNGLLDASEMSVSVETLLKIATDFHKRNEKSEAIAGLLPSMSAWEEALIPFMRILPVPGLSVTSVMKGAVHLVQSDDAASARSALSKLPRDAEGCSVAIRIAKYATGLLREVSPALSQEQMKEVFRLLALTRTLANHNVSISGANHMWSDYSPESEREMADLVSNMQALLTDWLREYPEWWLESGHSAATPLAITTMMNTLLGASGETSPSSFYNAESYSIMGSELLETHGVPHGFTEQCEQRIMSFRKDKLFLPLVATCVTYPLALSTSKVVTRYFNELVSELTTAEINTKSEEVLRKAILMNATHQALEDIEGVAKQRIIFLVKHFLPWLATDIEPATKAELFTVLSYLLPAMKDIYGDYWEQALTAITMTWSTAPELNPTSPELQYYLPLLHSSLRLFDGLSRLAAEEDANDDLVDAVKDSQKSASVGLFHILQCSKDCPDEYNQPLRVVNDIASRHITRISFDDLGELEDAYPLLFAPSQSVQQAAYGLVHRKIPSLLEHISLDAALSKTDAKLPEELISLVLEAPTTKDLEDAVWERGMPLPLRGYLLSWLLIFDHFEHASYKVKIDYLNSLKDIAALLPLLSFTFDFLGHSRGKPFDISKLDITNYDASTPSYDPLEYDTQHFLSHLYYLSLMYAPSLVKTWWLELRSRALVSSVEAWTEKFVSPHIISSSLASVSQWSAEQSDPSNPNVSTGEDNLKISVNQKAKEIRASYDIDEQTMSILIRLPDAWPLRQAEVQGISRVGVDEKKWQSWVRGCQGVITFSNNNLTDGLIAFRRNVIGAMKGQTECAICYSIISADKQLPSKRCSTCKNLFHSGCLYRWFKTSNASTCPLCRNPFNYG